MPENQELHDPIVLAEQVCRGRSLKRGELNDMIRALLQRIPVGEPEEVSIVPGGLEIRRTASNAVFIGTMNRHFTNDETRGVIHTLQLVLKEQV